MNAFEEYARYYDLFYRDKDYASEAAFVEESIHRYLPGPLTILELGCGTGRHARELVNRGHSVHGIDLSPGMLGNVPGSPMPGTFSCTVGDARSYRDSRIYGAVISLFHVMSYQVTNDDLLAAFTTAAAHLAPGGLFLFDAWYGPAVLTSRPGVRERRVSASAIEITRTATPRMIPQQDRVDVAYHVVVMEKGTGATDTIDEVHSMRYLFSPEVEFLLEAAGFDMAEQCEFLSGGALGFDSWNACFVGRKR